MGAIVVVATALAVWYLTETEGCDPVTGACFQAAWWTVPGLLLILAVGAGIMLFSIASTGTAKSQGAREAKNGTGEEPLHDWTGRLNELEDVIQATEEKILADQEDVQARILSANQTAAVEGGELVAGRAVVEGRQRIHQADQILPNREARTSPQAEDVMTPNERLVSIERWVQEAIRLSEEILSKENDLVESRKHLLELEEQLRSEFDVLTTEWDSLVARDRSLLMAVRHLIRALGAGRFPLTDEAVLPPPALPVAREEPFGSESEPGVPSVGPVRVTENDAVERMKKAVQGAKRAPDDRQDMPEVHNILKLALVSFRAGDFEDTIRHSEEVLEILRGAPSA